jgi:Cu(I)/Ag(I) efflux system membrane fusion protein
MKAKLVLLLIVVAVLAALGGWFAAKHLRAEKQTSAPTGRKILYYQSPMHPWITSDKPGRCTICGMQLEPVHEGERGFGGGEGVVTLGSNTVQVINVQTEVVTNRTLVRTLRVAGMIDDNDTKHQRLSAYAEGRVEKLFVNYVGAEVTAGQPLAVFYSPSLLAAESEFLALQPKNSAPEISETLRQERARLVEAAAQRLKRLGYSDAQVGALAKKDVADARTEILAPLTGTVVTRQVYEGQYVKEGDVLFEISDFSTMWFQFDAYEQDLTWLRVGQQVEVTTPAHPGRVFTAPIAFIDPNLNEMTRSAKVRVELENPIAQDGGPKRLLLHKMYANGAVKLQTPQVLTVPRSAVLSSGQPMVYVEVGTGTYEPRQLKLGRRGDEFWEVLSGVTAGERVVTSGGMLLDGQAQLDATARPMEGQTTKASDPMNATNDSVAGTLASSALSAAQQEAAKEFLTLAGEISAGLAADSLPRFNELAPRAHAAVPKLINALGDVKALRSALLKLEQSGHLEPAKDLPAARKTFLPFSMATAELAATLRTQEAFQSVKIFNCPMVDRAVPGAAKNGRWVQLTGPLRNPFFGADMLECGVEVKP